MVKCSAPGGPPGSKNGGPNPRLKVRACQVDLWLCSKCEDGRFGSISEPLANSTLIADESTSKISKPNHDFAALNTLNENEKNLP